MQSSMSTFLSALSVMLPTMVLISAATWLVMARLGGLKPDLPWTAADLRTWKLPYVLAEAAIFSVAFAAGTAIAGESGLGAAGAAAFASIAMLALGPLLPNSLKK